MSTFVDTLPSLRRFPDVSAPSEPVLELTADVTTADAGSIVAVQVEVEGVEEVDLRVEPAGAFSLDVRSIRKSGLVRLKGEMDAKATLIATARVRDGDAVRRMLHIDCVGPLLQLTGFGYVPADAE